MAYPTLSVLPNYPIEEGIADCTIKSAFEAGYVLTRTRHSRRKKVFKLNYNSMPNADKLSLEAHRDSVLDITPFNWTHPKTSTVYLVRFQQLFQFQNMQTDLWNCSFLLEQL
jgi:hypothetical protein